MKNYINLKIEKLISTKIGYYIFCLLAITVFGMIAIMNQNSDIAQAAPASAIRFEPSTLAVTNGQTFSLEARINPGTNRVSAVEIHVNFDATKFQVTEIQPSSSFPLLLSPGQFDNTAGTASITETISLPSPNNQPVYVTADTVVATFVFRAIGQSATSSISFAPETGAGAFEESGDVIINRTPAQITIGRRYTNADFSLLAADWLRTVAGSPADVNLDNAVDSRDLGIMMSNWSI